LAKKVKRERGFPQLMPKAAVLQEREMTSVRLECYEAIIKRGIYRADHSQWWSDRLGCTDELANTGAVHTCVLLEFA
jgi:hypothetical protein